MDYCRQIEETQPPHLAAKAMCECYAVCEEAVLLGHLDPFISEYVDAAMELYRVLSAVDHYDPWVNERTPYIDLSKTISQPCPYQYGDSSTIADFMLSWGWIFRVLEVGVGSTVLEYGAGEGQLSINLARMGCDVSIIDIDERYLEAVQAQCRALCINIHTQNGEFGDGVPDKLFDRIIFFEAFHHAFDHVALLDKLRPLLAPDGFILLSGEPIVEAGHPAVPFAWGPRLDGISVRSTRRFGWRELGFQRPYFIERMFRSGYTTQYIPCPVTGRGDCYVIRPMASRLQMGDPFDISVHGDAAGWHAPERTHRWTTSRAVLPIPDRTTVAEIHLKNHLPVNRTVVFRSGNGLHETRTLRSTESAVVRLVGAAGRLEICTDKTPTGLSDPRELGIAVESLVFREHPASL